MSMAMRNAVLRYDLVAGVHRHLAAMARNGLLRPGADDAYADGSDARWMDVDWSAMLRCERIDGRRVNVLDTGGEDKPVLLWLHGLSGLWQNWLLNLPAFMDRYRCIAPDLPGFGASEMPRDGEISIRGYARTIDRVCDALGVECPTVIGNSMGGFVGAELALTTPTRVDKLVLVSAAGLSTEYLRREPLLTGARLWTVMAAQAGARSELVVKRPRLRRAALQTVVRYPEKLSAPLAWEMIQGASTPGFIPALDALMGYSFRDKLARIEVPTLIVWGENDMLVPVGDAARYERLIGANAEKVIFEDTGHMAMIERPGRFNRVLDSFLAGDHAPERGVVGVSG
jgi:pimeloyl-ACP methyl ester carboxylesterase